MIQIQHKDSNPPFIHCVEESVVPDSVSVDIGELAFEAFDVGAEERIVTQDRINVVLDLRIERVQLTALLQLALKRLGFSNLKAIRRR
jgi:hypothetical protein